MLKFLMFSLIFQSILSDILVCQSNTRHVSFNQNAAQEFLKFSINFNPTYFFSLNPLKKELPKNFNSPFLSRSCAVLYCCIRLLVISFGNGDDCLMASGERFFIFDEWFVNCCELLAFTNSPSFAILMPSSVSQSERYDLSASGDVSIKKNEKGKYIKLKKKCYEI